MRGEKGTATPAGTARAEDPTYELASRGGPRPVANAEANTSCTSSKSVRHRMRLSNLIYDKIVAVLLGQPLHCYRLFFFRGSSTNLFFVAFSRRTEM